MEFSYSTNKLDKLQIGDAIEAMQTRAKDLRVSFERRWYDNNFFDDGYHFRYMQRSQNKIVDLSQNSTIWSPMRSIPKSSRQIRGISNLLASRQFIPIVYPEHISTTQFPPSQQMDPQTQQPTMVPNPEYKMALEEAKRVAKASGHYLTDEWKNQNLIEKLAFMIILTAKHGISYIQIWPDSVEEAIKTQVFDAFDVYVIGNYTNLEDCPFIIKTRPRLISEIKADENYELEQVLKINPDNRFASSEIKEAYSKARFGGLGNSDNAATVIEKEAFIKEYIDDLNTARIRQQKNGDRILQGKKKGDKIIRHTFVAGNITLKDEYVNLPGYPLVDLRFEPGPLYQVPLIERFIPANKSLDLVVSRVERFLHTMVAGSWSVKSGEPQEPTNTAGGQVFNYNTTPPIQNALTNVPPFVFNFMGLLESFMEEQGVTTTALGKIPPGVRAHAAIESLKESEFANLSIASDRVKDTIKKISEKIFDYTDHYFVTPKTVYFMDKGEPSYFDIIGGSAIGRRKEVGVDTPQDVIPIKKDYRVDIEVQSGLAYTHEGRKEAAKQLGEYLTSVAQLGLVSPEVVKVYFRQMLDTFQFGQTSEIMDAMDQFEGEGMMTDKQLDAIKVAVLETFKDLMDKGLLPTTEQRIDETKVGVAEVIKDTKLLDQKTPEKEDKGPSRSISFKDLPPAGKEQLAAQAGIEIDAGEIEADEQEEAQTEMAVKQEEMRLKEKSIEQKGETSAVTKGK